MITLKIANYTLEEKKIITDLFYKLDSELVNTYCSQNQDCQNCKIRTMCDDINRARMYAKRTYNECKVKNT